MRDRSGEAVELVVGRWSGSDEPMLRTDQVFEGFGELKLVNPDRYDR
jgi:hypothetical protein